MKKTFIFITIIILVSICTLKLKKSNYFEFNKETITYDNFTIKITDINQLVNNEIIGLIYIGRDTCPICLHFNSILEQEYKNNKLIIYKFDTDYWRESSDFQLVLDKYHIKQIPTLLKIKQNKEYEKFSIKNEKIDETEFYAEIEKFLYE